MRSSFLQLTDSQLLRAIYSAWDFQQALSAVTFLLEECDYESRHDVAVLRKFRCYETTAIVSFCRPLEPGRRQTVFGLNAFNIDLNLSERNLAKRIKVLREKVFAHSDENSMVFLAEVIEPLEDCPIQVPVFAFNESLYLQQQEAHDLQHLLRRIRHQMNLAFMEISRVTPERLTGLSRPRSPAGPAAI